MNISSVIAKGIGSAASKVLSSIDGLTTSAEERGKIKSAVLDSMAELQLSLEDNVTDRLKIDMNSDSWLSKNIRPASLVFTTIMVTILALTDGNILIGTFTFEVKEAYVKLMESLMLMQYTFYFGGRSVEKIMKSANEFRMSKVTRKERKRAAREEFDNE